MQSYTTSFVLSMKKKLKYYFQNVKTDVTIVQATNSTAE